MISLIASIGAKTRAIGKGGNLLYQIRDDMRHFKALTIGHPVIMGRKTWESIPEKFRPLSERTNIVITRDGTYGAQGATVVTSLEDALAATASASGNEKVFVMGGGEMYAATIAQADRLYLTLVEDDAEGDVFFPAYEDIFVKEVSKEEHQTPEGLKYSFVTLER